MTLGAGEKSIIVTRKVGPAGSVLSTQYASAIVEFARQLAQQGGLTNVETQVMDGEGLTLLDASFDPVLPDMMSNKPNGSTQVSWTWLPSSHQMAYIQQRYRPATAPIPVETAYPKLIAITTDQN